MKEVRQSLLIGVCLTSLGAAQSPSFLLDSQYRMIAEETEQAEREKAERSQREFTERQLHDRMNRVAEVWRGLVDEFNNKRAFNIRKARELSKAFRELEHSESWPKQAHK